MGALVRLRFWALDEALMFLRDRGRGGRHLRRDAGRESR
jgi:hypothetical protein